MNQCDTSAVELILQFSVGGITLRILIGLVKDWLKLIGLGAVLMGIVMCGLPVIAYMAIMNQWNWLCFAYWTFSVFTGTQVVYRATHK